MSYILKNWREAATLLLVANAKKPVVSPLQTTNFQLLMLKRSGKSKFMPALHVFPGGVADDSDFSPEWMDLYKDCGDSGGNDLQAFLLRGGIGTPMFSRTRPVEFSKVPSELAFRICAIRETFEESGILLARDVNTLKNEPLSVSSQPVSGKSSVLSEGILSPWRDRVNNDASQFLNMCKELRIIPDVWALHEWSNWLTPVMPSQGKGKYSRRYDTAFYMCVLDYIPDAIHCDKETTELEWASPGQFFMKHLDPQNSLQLAPPQIVELGRVLHFSDVEKLKKFSWERSRVRVQRWFPVICSCDNGTLILYPGDGLYPDDPDLEGTTEIMSVKGTISELRKKFPKMNRSEVFKDKDDRLMRTIVCNIEMPDGQVAPLFDFDGNTFPDARL